MNIRTIERWNVPSASSGIQGPPESAKMRGLTAKMYAMVKKVAKAPRNSVVKLDPRASNSKKVPMGD
jgi:hypothetical protein